MTREEAVKEIEKAFEPAFANYIITALTEGATASDKEQEPCEDAVSRDDVVRIVQHNNPRKALEKIRKLPSVTPQEPNTWSLDDAREDFMYDVYNELDFLPTNEEANRIIDIFDRVTRSIEQEHKWIPVTERLPNKLTDVNIAFDDCPNEYDVAYLRTTINETYRKNGAEYEWVSSMGEATYADYEVSAWMAIQPYKAESEVEE